MPWAYLFNITEAVLQLKTSASCEKLFSLASYIVNKRELSFGPQTVKMLVWLWDCIEGDDKYNWIFISFVLHSSKLNFWININKNFFNNNLLFTDC